MLYKFYAFPDKSRLRLSQLLVVPPYQGQGIGSALLRAAYALAARDGATDVPVRAHPFCFLPGLALAAHCCAALPGVRMAWQAADPAQTAPLAFVVAVRRGSAV